MESLSKSNKKRDKVSAGFHGDPAFSDSRSPNEVFSGFKGVITP